MDRREYKRDNVLPSMPRAPLVSVVILNYNGRRFLRTCIESLRRQTLQDFEIIFVDNASSDGSAAFVESSYPDMLSTGKLLIIRNATNQGFAEGNNIGHRAAKGKYVLLLNNDTRASARLLERLDPRIATAGGFVLDKGKERLYRRIIEKERRSLTITLCGDNVSAPPSREERQLMERQSTPIRKQFYVSGAALMYRKNEHKRPFERFYFLYAEDTCLGWQSLIEGKRNVIRTDAIVYHYGSGTQRTVRGISKVAVFHGTKNQLANILLFYDWKTIVRILPLLMIVQIGHILENPRKIIVKPKAYWWVLSNMGLLLRKRREMQARRSVPDKEILRGMSCAFYDAEITDGKARRTTVRVMNGLFYAYCAIVRLKTCEFYR